MNPQELLFEDRVSKIVYHGSNSRFSKFNPQKARIPNDLYGGGVAYFTDNLKIGIRYAKAMSKYQGEPYLYTVTLSLSNIFDVDSMFTGNELINLLPDDLEGFARGSRLLSLGTDKYKVIYALQSGEVELTGEQVFRGLSKGMTNTREARNHLKQQGYDGLRYNGGMNMNMDIKHNVYLAYDSDSIDIKKRQRVVKKTA